MYDLEHVKELYNRGEKQEFIFFTGHQKSLNGIVTKNCLSQWYQSPFEMNNEKYRCVEEYMMCEKAKLFNDEEAIDRIRSAYHPNQIKLIGRQIKNFDNSIWDENKIQIVKIGNLAKFSQNAKLKKYLRSTSGKVLAKAVPRDLIWGIGMTKDDPFIENPINWNGKNLLGFILMDIRDILS